MIDEIEKYLKNVPSEYPFIILKDDDNNWSVTWKGKEVLTELSVENAGKINPNYLRLNLQNNLHSFLFVLSINLERIMDKKVEELNVLSSFRWEFENKRLQDKNRVMLPFKTTT